MTALIWPAVGCLWLAIGIICGAEAAWQANNIDFRRDWSPPRLRMGIRVAALALGLLAPLLNIYWLYREFTYEPGRYL